MTVAWSDLDLPWDRYYALITSQRRRNPETKREIHVVDHPDGSYLQEIEECQSVFAQYPSFTEMPPAQRRLVAGWGTGGRRYLGSMRGAGWFKHLVLDSPGVIGAKLDGIPAQGPVSLGQVESYLRSMLALRGVGIAAATRLLAVKRPDACLVMTGANKRNIRDSLGESASASGYLSLHRRIWSLAWFHAPEPGDREQRRVWRARVALLDVLFYEVLP